MTPERWQHVKTLLDDALERPAAERLAFVRQATEDDAVRREVEALLASEPDDAFLSVPPALPLDAMAATDGAARPAHPTLAPGTRIGRYRIEGALGEGGMGRVYAAARADGAFEQAVALKIIKRGMDTDAVRQRFESERQILARLQHPHIAHLIDGGATDDGMPYFVMEKVEGEPITAFARTHALGIDARLRLFLQVCDAVAFAHRNLVVHRDLKPSNVLVSREGTATLLDFGIARLLEGDAQFTETGTRPMSRPYAAPEQVAGGPITTATDVWALGVLLYELLTDTRPFGAPTQVELEKAILEQPPRPPSRREPTEAAPPTDVRALRGDLDAVCLTALAKEPVHRYASAEALADDLRRHLDGMPVVARPPTASYRARTFVRRHRTSVAVGALALALLLASGIFYTVRVTQERNRAQLEAAKLAQVTGFLSGLFASADPVQAAGDTLTVREVLDRGTDRLAVELDGQPIVQAQLLDVIGEAYRNLGRYPQADSLLHRSLALRRAHQGPEHEETLATYWALIDLRILQHRDQEAEGLLRDYLAIQQRRLGPEHPKVFLASFNLATTLHLKGERDEADSLFQRWIARHEATPMQDDADLANALMMLGNYRFGGRHWDEAARTYQQALAMKRRLLGPAHPDVAWAFTRLAGAYAEGGRCAEAEAAAQEALALQRTLYPGGHRDQAIALAHTGECQRRAGDLGASERGLREALAMMQRVFTHDDHLVGWSHLLLAQTLHAQRNWAEAEAHYRASVAVYLRMFGPVFPTTLQRQQALAAFLADAGRPGEALRLYQDVYQTLVQARGRDDRFTQEARANLLAFYERRGQPVPDNL